MVKFLFFSNENLDNPEEVKPEEIHLPSSFNPSNPTRILIHGLYDGPKALVNKKGKEALFKKGSYNIIVIDWSTEANDLYPVVLLRIKNVGFVVSNLINHIFYRFPQTKDTLGIIGHSLGAHVAGIAGRNVTHGKVDFIVGLDPAGPLMYKNKNWLDKSDAKSVQVIHTSISFHGYEKPLGHADFYPNYGCYQPGCDGQEASHMHAINLWAESVNSDAGFWGIPCTFEEIKRKCLKNEDGRMRLMGGDPVDKTIEGVFYVKTNCEFPYAIGVFETNKT